MNIFIEGLQGMGKTTLLRRLSQRYPACHVFREGDYCPVELAWCSYMTQEEYAAALAAYPSTADEIRRWTTREDDRYIVAYTRIITDEPGFHKYMEQYEIYNGRRTLEELKDIIFKRYQKLPAEGEENLFECAFFQNLVEELLLFQQMSDDEICAFYRELYHVIPKDNFRLYYLYGENIEEVTMEIRIERSDESGNQLWYQLVMGYLKESPYGKAHHLETFEDLTAHFRHRQELEMRMIREILGERAVVLTARNYTDRELMLSWEPERTR